MRDRKAFEGWMANLDDQPVPIAIGTLRRYETLIMRAAELLKVYRDTEHRPAREIIDEWFRDLGMEKK